MSGLALVKEHGHLASRPRIAYTACPLCSSGNFREYAAADCSKHPLYTPLIPAKIQWMRCTDCEHVFTDGYFSPEQTEALFAKAHDRQLPGHTDLERGRAVSSRIVERVSQQVQSGRWLDVGFGDGSLLMTAQEFGFEPFGIDVRQDAVTKMREFGIAAHRETVQSYWDNDHRVQYTVISMADVLEHERSPVSVLDIVRNLLAPGGVLFVSCPNMDTTAWRALTKVHANPYWIEIEHFQQFTRKRLAQLLRDCGFEVLSYAVSERYRLGGEIIARKSGI